MQITVTSYRPKKRDFSPKTEEEEGKKPTLTYKS